MFYNCAIHNIDLSSAVFDNVTSYDLMFDASATNLSIKVKNASAKTFIEARLSEDNINGNVYVA